MSCLYCGKHVSLVRARFDADFCTKEHRNQHSARTRREFDRLVQAQQETSAARHLNETLPLPARQADQRDNLDRLVSKQPGPALLLPSKPGILPRSRARLETAVRVLDGSFFKVMQVAGTIPQPVSEPAGWNTDRPATWSRPPHPLLHIGALPECGSVFVPLDPAGFRRQPSTNPSPAAEFGAGSPGVPRFRTRFAASMPVALTRPEPAPDPITLPSAVASVTKLPPPAMSIHLGRPRPSRMEIGNVPAALPVRAETLA